MLGFRLDLNSKFVLPVFTQGNTCSTGNVLWLGGTAKLLFTLTTFELPSGGRQQTQELASARI